jgi:two-component system chemotaxis response regulator CheY
MNKTILIVDDFESSRNILEKMLCKAGYTVLKGEDGQDALKYFDGQPIDLVITDLNMPNMNGMELSRSVRGTGGYEFVPIILLTTSTKPEQLAQAQSAGVTVCMKKPYEVEPLLKNITRMIR